MPVQAASDEGDLRTLANVWKRVFLATVVAYVFPNLLATVCLAKMRSLPVYVYHVSWFISSK